MHTGCAAGPCLRKLRTLPVSACLHIGIFPIPRFAHQFRFVVRSAVLSLTLPLDTSKLSSVHNPCSQTRWRAACFVLIYLLSFAGFMTQWSHDQSSVAVLRKSEVTKEAMRRVCGRTETAARQKGRQSWREWAAESCKNFCEEDATAW